MLDTLIDILNGYSGLEYRILEEKTTRAESFYIKKRREMNRNVDVTHLHLTIYKVFEENGKTYRGSSTTRIHPTMTADDVKTAIDEAIYAAGFVKNEYYPLVGKGGEPQGTVSSGLALYENLREPLDMLKDAVYAADTRENGYLSYSEFFVKKSLLRIINSSGVDAALTQYSADIETGVNFLGNNGEIEICEMYKFADCDTKLINERIEKLFLVASTKPGARPTPAVKDINILLTGECLREFFSYFYTNANAASVYNKQSVFKIGDDLQQDGEGDRITMTLDPFLPGSTSSRPYDSDGLPLSKVELIKDGILLGYWGDTRHSSYLGITPTGGIGNYIVTGGSQTIAEMKAAPYLELVSFSGFEMNPVTGDFGSEIRLGFYFDGKETVPVTGGSISGNIKNVRGGLRMSVEQSQYNNYFGPRTISIRNVSIAGTEVGTEIEGTESTETGIAGS